MVALKIKEFLRDFHLKIRQFSPVTTDPQQVELPNLGRHTAEDAA